MKPEGQIAQKTKQLRFRHLKRELERLLKRTSRNCKNNTIVSTPGGSVGVCKLDCDTCDSSFKDRAPSCELFENSLQKEQIKESLKNFFETRPVHDIAVRFPDVAALQWVLEEQPGPLIPDTVQVCSLGGIPLWVDSDAEVQVVEPFLRGLLSHFDKMNKLEVLLGLPSDQVLERVSQLLNENAHLTEENASLSPPMGDVSFELQERVTDGSQPEEAMTAPHSLRIEIPRVSWWRRISQWLF